MSDDKFDENKANTEMDRYSRAIAALGIETMRNLGGLDVLVIGQEGVGIETAKNLVLAGPRSVTVWDEELASIENLGTNFYLRPEHVGKVKRSVACRDSLSELNPYVKVKVLEGKITAEALHNYGTVVVSAHLPQDELIRINEICRSHHTNSVPTPITFIMALTFGVTFSLFSDFGDKHLVTDADGETVDSMIVEGIDEFGVVSVAVKQHGLEDGDFVKFSDIEGATYLNDMEKVEVKRIYHKIPDLDSKKQQKVDKDGKKRWRNVQVLNKFQITNIPADIKQTPYKNGGIIDYVKPQKLMHFRSLAESLVNPCVDEFQAMMNHVGHIDEGRMSNGQGSQLHIALCSVLDFQKKNGKWPTLHSEEDAQECIKIAHTIVDANKGLKEDALQIEELNEKVIRQFAIYSQAELPGLCAFLGGVVAQEVVKKFGKYTPMYQWVVGDYFELLPEDGKVREKCTPIGSRYDHQISIFGEDFQHKLTKQKVFLVGCGALGCEYIKGLALMGVGADKEKEGVVHITDMDRIELSNLSRQFLFRQKHVGKPKSVSAAQVAVEMNTDLNLVCHETKVDTSTENIFVDKFWDDLDLVWNALDNIHARLYTDNKCLLHEKPLLESGTEGTKANSSVHLPHQTPAYGDTPAQETGKIAACTLRNFPHLIVHCIEWARPRFESLFEFDARSFATLLEDPNVFFEQTGKEAAIEQVKIYKRIKHLLIASKTRSFETCIKLAFAEFDTQFNQRIKDLIYSFPADARMTRTTEDGETIDLGPFWAGKKRFPNVASFDYNDPLQMQFLFAASNLYAAMFNVPHVRDMDEFVGELKKANLSHAEWSKPSEAVDISDDNKEEETKKEGEEAKDDDIAESNKLQKELFDMVANEKFETVTAADFEKDDDTNFHIDFIHACSNMRAWNYRIQPASRLKAKVIAGKIIAALASTTAMITGLTEMEYYKIVLGLKKVKEDKEKGIKGSNPYFDANCNLAVAKFSLFECHEAPGHFAAFDEAMQCDVKAVPDGWTSWDYIVVNKGDLTIDELAHAIPDLHHGCELVDLSKIKFTQEEIDAGKGGFLYEAWTPMPNMKSVYEERKKRKITDVYQELYGPLPDSRRFIVLQGNLSVDDEEVSVPPIKYVFRSE